MGKYWSKEEIEYLKDNYAQKGCKKISEYLGRSRSGVQKKAKVLGLRANPKITYKKEDLEIAVKKSYSFSDVFRYFGKVSNGASNKIIKRYIEEYNIDISHFDPFKKQRENIQRGVIPRSYPLKHWLQEGSNIGSSDLKKRLYKEGLKKKECEMCGQGEEWKGKKMSLILDHINGVNNDNRLENLRIVCPNCNATLDTHCGKNNKTKKKFYYCSCGKKKSKAGKKCNFCYLEEKSSHLPTKEELVFDKLHLKTFTSIAKKYGVSDNAVRKWFKKYNI